jgi:dihydrofolate reductase
VVLHLIWAQARGGVIGAAGGIPWRVPEDLRRFKALTHGSGVLMGRRTWDSLPPAVRPLPGRRNLVLTRDTTWTAPGAERVGTLEEAAAEGDLWVIGGAEIYRLALPFAEDAHVTEVDVDVPGDTFAPVLVDPWRVTARDPADGWHRSVSGPRYRHLTFRRGG